MPKAAAETAALLYRSGEVHAHNLNTNAYVIVSSGSHSICRLVQEFNQ